MLGRKGMARVENPDPVTRVPRGFPADPYFIVESLNKIGSRVREHVTGDPLRRLIRP